ncbi:Zinc finger matrin-type protein 2 [Grifola frondosa]|uniref:Zinc finger matrin-type protein 2 n=1 Tax=Grifola frondosa TaxID=5627 RepID=A0A1C7LR81_GRIFR|nr:Zinc finger matrin-type protein 2 [Grifola frondosa]
MASKGGAYGTRAQDTDFRKKWDKEEYAEKARQRDQDEKERMQENEERLKQGKKPRKGRREDLPKPTELMKRREASLELEKNLGKTMVVQNAGTRGPGVPGFYCETCNRTYKDSAGYLDHINGRAHLRALGQTTRIERSTVEQVRARIAYLREKTREASTAKSFDFEQRLAEVREREAALRAEKKAAKKAQRERVLVELAKDTTAQPQDDMMQMMGSAASARPRNERQ